MEVISSITRHSHTTTRRCYDLTRRVCRLKGPCRLQLTFAAFLGRHQWQFAKMETHKAFEGYSAKNPVPKVSPAVALKSLVNPSSATEEKAKHLRTHDKKEQQDQSATEDSTKRMVKGELGLLHCTLLTDCRSGKEVRVEDPVTGVDTVRASGYSCWSRNSRIPDQTVRHGGDGEEETDTRTTGENSKRSLGEGSSVHQLSTMPSSQLGLSSAQLVGTSRIRSWIDPVGDCENYCGLRSLALVHLPRLEHSFHLAGVLKQASPHRSIVVLNVFSRTAIGAGVFIAFRDRKAVRGGF